MKLTKRMIDAARYQGDGKTRDVRWDDDPRGLGCRIYPSGEKAFILKYRTRSGRQRMLTIGRYGVLTLEQARVRAKRELTKVLDGADPVVERRAQRTGDTVRELARLYIDRHARPHKKSWKEDQRRIDTHVLPAIGGHRVADVKRADIAKLHSRVGQRGHYEANRVLALVSTMFVKSIEWGIVDEDTKNPARGIQTFKENERDRWITHAEMPKLAKAIEAEPNVFVRALIWLYLLTGCRKTELLSRKWKDVDFDRRELRLPDTKNGKPHIVPLNLEAVKVLRELPRFRENEHVFPGHVRGRPLVNIAKNWRNVRRAAELEDVTVHDLRRTLGSWMATSGVSLHIIGAVLNHQDGGTTRIYARLAKDAERQALDAHGKQLLTVANGEGVTERRG